jgi:pimeloyl-ACP methyl ester carboxylesterase
MSTNYVTANGIRIAWDDFGDATHPAIVLIMGLGTQMIAWPVEMCEQLAAHGFRVVRFDNRDIGLSEKFDHAKQPSIPAVVLRSKLNLPGSVPYTLNDMADDAIGLLDALDINRAHIVGASMGGMIAQLVTAKVPLRAISLTSIMSSSGEPSLPQAKAHILAKLLKSPPQGDALIEHRMDVIRTIGSQKYPMDEDKLREKVLASYNRNSNPPGVLRQMAAIVHHGSRVKALRTITTPTLVIHGREDPLVPVEAGIDTARNIANSKLSIIDGMGHDLPGQLLPTIVDLIASHVNGQAA